MKSSVKFYTLEEPLMIFNSCTYIVYKVKNFVEGLFKLNTFSNQLIYTNQLLNPLIIGILLKWNHDLFHRFDMLHRGVH